MPSKDLMEEMGTAEKKRLALQAEELKDNGLAEKQKELDHAVEQNEVNRLILFIIQILLLLLQIAVRFVIQY